MFVPEVLPRCLLRSPRPSQARHKFLKAEDDQLRLLVSHYGESDWNLISRFMSRRNARQCRERYKNYLSPTCHRSEWTAEEEALLSEKVKEFGTKWSRIAQSFPGRSDVNVKNHWAAICTRNARVERYSKLKGAPLEALQDSSKDFELFFWSSVAVPPGAGGDDSEFD
jgi:hypothetical protein